jgi:uncharacterized protein YndB with AHSA1/START domain
VTTELAASRSVPGSAEQVWAVLADFAAISRWAPNVDHSAPATEPAAGIGAVRRVQSGRVALLERVVEWRAPAELAYQLIGLPPPAGTVLTRWSLAEQGDSTLVTVTTTISPLPGPPGRIVSRVLGRRLAAAAETMLGGLAGYLPSCPPVLEEAP